VLELEHIKNRLGLLSDTFDCMLEIWLSQKKKKGKRRYPIRIRFWS